jgi:hypothetical protein
LYLSAIGLFLFLLQFNKAPEHKRTAIPGYTRLYQETRFNSSNEIQSHTGLLPPGRHGFAVGLAIQILCSKLLLFCFEIRQIDYIILFYGIPWTQYTSPLVVILSGHIMSVSIAIHPLSGCVDMYGEPDTS